MYGRSDVLFDMVREPIRQAMDTSWRRSDNPDGGLGYRSERLAGSLHVGSRRGVVLPGAYRNRFRPEPQRSTPDSRRARSQLRRSGCLSCATHDLGHHPVLLASRRRPLVSHVRRSHRSTGNARSARVHYSRRAFSVWQEVRRYTNTGPHAPRAALASGFWNLPIQGNFQEVGLVPAEPSSVIEHTIKLVA
jgi:hypothetical protein